MIRAAHVVTAAILLILVLIFVTPIVWPHAGSFDLLAPWKHPRSLQGIVFWEALPSKDPRLCVLQDKLRLRFVAEACRATQYVDLPRLLWSASTPEECQACPQNSVLKTNSSCRQVRIMRDRSMPAFEVQRQARSWLRSNHIPFWERAYAGIPKRVFAESLIISGHPTTSVPCPELQVFCIRGIPEQVQIRTTAQDGTEERSMYWIPRWERQPGGARFSRATTRPHIHDIEKPRHLQ